MLTAVAISNYRSLRNIIVPLQELNVVLIEVLREHDCNSITLEKSFGEITIAGADDMYIPDWHWLPVVANLRGGYNLSPLRG
jgi:hypothetical protein